MLGWRGRRKPASVLGWHGRGRAAGQCVSSSPVACSLPVMLQQVQRVAPEPESWRFAEGAEIAPGRTVLKPLGGGSRYEVCLVWDDGLFALAVAKLLRPDQVEDERALAELREEAEALEALAHPVLVRGSTPCSTGRTPTS